MIGAADLRKVHPYRLDAFDAGDAGAIAGVAQGRLTVWRDWVVKQGLAPVGLAVVATEVASWPVVGIVSSHAGVDARWVDALVGAGVHGIVVAATGNGTVHAVLESALQRAVSAGIAVVRSSRCAVGALVGQGADALLVTGASEALPPFAGAGALTPVQARIELMLALMARRAAGAAT